MAEGGKGRGWHGDPQGHADAGRKGGLIVSKDREHMARIGRKGGQASGASASTRARRTRTGGGLPNDNVAPVHVNRNQPGLSGTAGGYATPGVSQGSRAMANNTQRQSGGTGETSPGRQSGERDRYRGDTGNLDGDVGDVSGNPNELNPENAGDLDETGRRSGKMPH